MFLSLPPELPKLNAGADTGSNFLGYATQPQDASYLHLQDSQGASYVKMLLNVPRNKRLFI